MLIVDVRVFRVFCVEKHAGIVSVELSMSFPKKDCVGVPTKCNSRATSEIGCR